MSTLPLSQATLTTRPLSSRSPSASGSGRARRFKVRGRNKRTALESRSPPPCSHREAAHAHVLTQMRRLSRSRRRRGRRRGLRARHAGGRPPPGGHIRAGAPPGRCAGGDGVVGRGVQGARRGGGAESNMKEERARVMMRRGRAGKARRRAERFLLPVPLRCAPPHTLSFPPHAARRPGRAATPGGAAAAPRGAAGASGSSRATRSWRRLSPRTGRCSPSPEAAS